MPGIFHSQFNGTDVVYVVYDPLTLPTRVEEKEDMVALYEGDRLLGVNLFHYGEGLPIGLLPLPHPAFLFALSERLLPLGLGSIALDDSGYHVATVIQKEEHPLDERKSILTLKEGEKTFVTSTRYANLEIGNKIVVLHDGHFRHDGTLFTKSIIRNINQDVEICSPADLGIGEESKLAHLTTKEEGQDFFAEN